MNSFVGSRTIQSAGNDVVQSFSPYQRAQTTGSTVDKSGLIWKDFLSGVKKRKLLIKRLHDSALESSTPISVLKKTLLELRQLTLAVIEDALEIEYRSRIDASRTPKGTVRNARLPPITSFRAMEEKEDIFSLADMITDVDDLFGIPNIRVMLPMQFPSSRNTFMLAKTVDEMAVVIPPHPEPGNAEEELKVLELLRYKRACRALLRAETQIMNRLPINLHDLEKVLHRMTDDLNMEKLIRCVCTLLDNEFTSDTDEANLNCLLRPMFNVEAHELLSKLNLFKGARPLRIDVQVAVRQTMREYNLEHFGSPTADPATRYLVDWLDLVMGATKAAQDDSQTFMADHSVTFNQQNLHNTASIVGTRGSAPPSRFGRGQSLGTISETPGLIPMPLTSAALQLVQQRPLTSVSVPPTPKQRPGTSHMMISEEDDLVSEVDSKTGYLQTHEGIYVEPKPILKMQPRRMPSPLVDVIASAAELNNSQRPGSAQGIRNSAMTMMKRSATVPALTSLDDKKNPDKQARNVKAKTKSSATQASDKVEGEEGDDQENDDDTADTTNNDQSKDNSKGSKILKANPALLRRKIRSEVERALHDLHLKTHQSNPYGGNDNGDQGPNNGETLTSVRYELNRLQQELIRRQILDPHHYALSSVDAATHARHGLTVSDVNAFDLDEQQKATKRTRNSDLQSPVFLTEKKYKLHLRNGELEVSVLVNLFIYDRKIEFMITAPIQEAFRHGLINDMPIMNQHNENAVSLLASTSISELIFSRLTNHTFDEFLQVKKVDDKVKILQNIFDQFEEYMLRINYPDPSPVLLNRGNFYYFNTNRELFLSQLTQDNVLVDVAISRNEMCNGTIMRITPVLGLFPSSNTMCAKDANMGPVIINLADYELEVLLLHDHGLFLRGLNQWNAMVVIAQWLCTRLIVRKIPAATLDYLPSTNNLRLTSENLLANTATNATMTIKEEDEEKQSDLTSNSFSPRRTLSAGQPRGTLMILDVSLDRLIDLSSEVVEMWKAVNTPHMVGTSISIYAQQELEVMVITLNLTVPGRLTYQRLLKELNKAEKKNTNDEEDEEKEKDDLLNFLDEEIAEEEENKQATAEDLEGTKLEFLYRLTRAECLVFGFHPLVTDNKQLSISHTLPNHGNGKSNKKKDKNNKLVGANQHQQLDDHPANLLWNILSRLTFMFLGKMHDPYQANSSALDQENWKVDYNRLLIRDVKTISNRSLIVTVFNIGSELQIEAEPVSESHYNHHQNNHGHTGKHDGGQKNRVISKVLSAQDIRTFVLEEGHPLSLLEFSKRKDLAVKILDFLKLVAIDEQSGLPTQSVVEHHYHSKKHNDHFPLCRLELQSFLETRIISISLVSTSLSHSSNDSLEEELGNIEINSAQTLADIRVLIKHEFEMDVVPTQYRFIYKGVECSLRQEAFRRAWDCAPIIHIIRKEVTQREFGTETDDILKRRMLMIAQAKPKNNPLVNNDPKANFPKLLKGQRRIVSTVKMTPIPLSTLCYVTEGKSQIFFLHPANDLLVAGDVIRVGHVTGRDYIVMSVGARLQSSIQSNTLQLENGENSDDNQKGISSEGDVNMQVIEIEPNYDLLSEPDFNTPIMGNFPFPSRNAGMVFNEEMKRVRILKRPQELGFDYNFSGLRTTMLVLGGDDNNNNNVADQAQNTQPMTQTQNTQSLELSEDESVASQTSLISANNTRNKLLTPSKDRVKNTKKGKKKAGSRSFAGVWVWKVIPASQDTRPKWRQLYDDGLIQYEYEYQNSEEFLTFFRVKAYFSYIEVLCTDSRVPEFTFHAQRIYEMRVFSADFYVQYIFTQMTQHWHPEYKKGIDRTKFIKLMRDTPTFPDLKVKAARVAQLDNLFTKVAKSPEFGLVGKYVSYQGFVHLLKLIALIRYPYKAKEGEDKDDGGKTDAIEKEKRAHEHNTKAHGKHDKSEKKSNAKKKKDVIEEFSDDLSSIDTTENHSDTSLSHSHTNDGQHTIHTKKSHSNNSHATGSHSHAGSSPLKQALTHGHGNTHNTSSSHGHHSKHRDNKHYKDSNDDNDANSLAKVDLSHLSFAYQKLLTDHLMMYPTWYDYPWKEAKRLAMHKESIRYCAQTRIASLFRMFRQRKLYKFCLRQIIVFQGLVRRKIAKKQVANLLRLLSEDWYFRYRYYFATQITKIVRRYLKRCWYYRTLVAVRRNQVLLMKARRQKLKKLKDNKKKTKVYSEAKRINGVMCISKISRKDPRNYTKDFGLWLDIYVPSSQQTFTFLISDDELRLYMSVALEIDIETHGVNTLAVWQLLDKRNLKIMLSQRLIVHKANKKSSLPLIQFSKHALGQKGELKLTRGWVIPKSRLAPSINSKLMQGVTSSKFLTAIHNNHQSKAAYGFIVKLFETGEDVSVQLHHSLTCKVFTLVMTQHDLKEWIHEEHALSIANTNREKNRQMQRQEQQHQLQDESKSIADASPAQKVDISDVVDEGPSILHSKKKLEFYHWILSHMTVDTRHGQFKVVWSNAYEKSRKKESIVKIQSIWRRALVRPILVDKLDKFMLKVKTGTFDSTFYYLNLNTGVSQWEKPKLLGPQDLPTKPVRKWITVNYYDEYNGWSIYFVNPYTGKYTSLVPEQAAKIMQKLARKYLLKPLQMNKASFITAAKIVNHAEKEFKLTMNMRKLKPVINYALFMHAYQLDELNAKDIYRQAVDLSESNPLVTRAYAFYLISTCEAPLQLNRDRAMILLADAKRKDPTHSKFTTAYSIFQIACLRHPTDHRALVNLAIVQSMLYNNNYNAEKLLRRALAIAPFEQRVMEIWNLLKDNFPERHLLYNPMSRVNNKALRSKQGTPIEQRKVVHGRPVLEDPSWAGWVFVEVDKYHVSKRFKDEPYWYNPADGSEQASQPNWKEQWEIRKARSYYEGEAYNLEQYYDPLTAEYFQYHALTESYQ